jgi:hypothetical protein
LPASLAAPQVRNQATLFLDGVVKGPHFGRVLSIVLL